MGRPKGSRADQTVDRLLQAATRAFASLGHERATLADIAREAGISRPSLLYHFDSKDALYAAVVRGVFAELGAALAQAMAEPSSFDHRVGELARVFATFLAEHRDHARLVVRELLQDDGVGAELLREQAVPLLDAVVVFAETVGSGRLRPALNVRATVMQIAADALLQHAAGALREPLWGPADAERTAAAARTLLLAEDR